MKLYLVNRPNAGVECFEYTTIRAGDNYQVESKTCRDGKYPKNQYCAWYFHAEDCSPAVQCDEIDIKGKGKK